ncbi:MULTISPECIES: TonB-dependent receptor domain-containing protein [unclassified Polaribacter]|uniref:TonB-dependent receptor n=1 Tax=unclassified Polaribacter TaxID=196858 RepID=UPI0011BF5172|nr:MULTISPECIES: TonB-dependent receptor [unclassified Polaribacter]TXD51835.1 TonB-dependent receptor [Polaribacter sp. IC063]TXD59384.1 TonB-dependent receptor [Polaribacter sp. IC066]
MKYLIIVFFIFVGRASFAQEITVLDKETGKKVKNVTIFNEGNSVSLTTDNNGVADIASIEEQELIFFSHLSYAIFRIKKAVLRKQNFIIYLTKESEELDEVVISAFKTAEKSKRIAEQIAVVSLKDIQKISPQTSADLLATIPGIKVQKSQFGGGSPVIRGMESNRVLLVVDGVRMNNAIYRKGHLQNSISLSPNLLEKTEVVFGPSSVIYGSDALGGVIHYYTKTPKLSEESQVISQLFSRFSSVNQETTTNVSAELRFSNWASFTSISYSDFGDLKAGQNRNHGFSDWGKVFYFSENVNGNYNENPTINSNPNLLRNTGFHQTDVLQKFFIPLSENTDLKINLQYSESSDIPRFDRLTELKDITNTASLKFAEWNYGPQKRLLISSQLRISPNKNWLESGTITTAYQNVQESRIQRKFGSLDRSYREETVNIFSVNGDFSVALDEDKTRTLSYGFEFAYNDVGSNAYGKTLTIVENEITGFSNDFKVQSRYPDGGSNFLTSAVYVGYRQDLNSKSTLNTGIRFTNTNKNATWVDETFLEFDALTLSRNNSAVTATLGYVYKPSRNWQLNSVLSSGFRSPNIDDIGRVREKAGNVTVPNIHVSPEFAYNAEIGILKYFNKRKFRLGANIYYTLLDNYIQRDFVYTKDGSIKQVQFDGEFGNAVNNQNKGTAYIFGYTLNYLGKISKTINTTGFITYTKGRTYDTEEPMSSIPPLFGQFAVNYKKDKIELGTVLRFNSKKDIEDFNFTEGIDNHELTPVVDANAAKDIDTFYGAPSWITLGINGRYLVNDTFSVQARLDNILDEHYIEFASGVSSPARNLSISFTADF